MFHVRRYTASFRLQTFKDQGTAAKSLLIAEIRFESSSVIVGFVGLLFGSFKKICEQEWLLLLSILVSA